MMSSSFGLLLLPSVRWQTLQFCFNSLLIKTDNDFAGNDDDRHRHPPGETDHLFPRLRITGHVSLLIRYPVLRKELLRLVAVGSRRCGKDLDIHLPLLSYVPSFIRWAICLPNSSQRCRASC